MNTSFTSSNRGLRRVTTPLLLLPALLLHSGCQVCGDKCKLSDEDESSETDGIESTTAGTTGTSSDPTSSDTSVTSVGTSSGAEVTGSTEVEVTGSDDLAEDVSSEEVETESETGPEDDLCGNGIVDAGEACDDGDHKQLDGCSNDCQFSPSIVWDKPTQLSGDRNGRTLSLGPSGEIRVHGETDDSLYVNALSAEGEPRWNYRFRAGDQSLWQRQAPHNVVVNAEGYTYILGGTYNPDDGPHSIIGRLYIVAPDGSFAVDGLDLPATDDLPVTAGITAEGHLAILNMAREDPTADPPVRTLTIWHYDRTGQRVHERTRVLSWQDDDGDFLGWEPNWAQPTGTEFILGFGHRDVQTITKTEGDNGVAWVHNFPDSVVLGGSPWPTWTQKTGQIGLWSIQPNHQHDEDDLYKFHRINLDGTRDDVQPVEITNLAGFITRAAVGLPDGSFLVGGSGRRADAGDAGYPWLWHFDADGHLKWNSALRAEPGFVFALAPLSDKELIVGHDVEASDPTAPPWVMRIALP